MTYYDDISSGYEELHKEEQLKKIELVKKEISVKDSLLDVGCGTGFCLDEFDVDKKTGVDPSEKLVEIGNKKGRNLSVGKAENLEFDDDSFDTVISVTAVQNFNDIKKGLLEMKRVSSRQVVVSCLKKSDKLTVVDKHINSIFDVWKKVEEEKDIIYFCNV